LLAHEIRSSPGHAREIGAARAVDQATELTASDAPSLHLFVMTKSGAVNNVLAPMNV
jgi:hypothetical protein